MYRKSQRCHIESLSIAYAGIGSPNPCDDFGSLAICPTNATCLLHNQVLLIDTYCVRQPVIGAH